MAPNQVNASKYSLKRVTITSNKPYEKIREALESKLGRIDAEELDQVAERGDREGMIRYLDTKLGSSGFSVFHSLDQGRGMTTLGSPMKSVYYLIGNVLLAQQMFQHDPALGLRIPIRVVLFENAKGQAVIEYETPSSLLGSYEALKSSSVPKVLDEKFFELLSQAAN